MVKKKKVVIIGVIVAILLFIFTGLAYFLNHSFKDKKSTFLNKTQGLSITKQIQNNNQEVIKITDEKSAEELLKLKSKPIIIAIFGSDARSSETSRSDVIMLMKYYPMTNAAVIISVPRDTRVDIPGKGIDKINHAYAFGKEKLLTQTLDKLFSIKIDYYLKFNFSDFESIVDKFGGVKVNSDKDYGYSETVVPKGTNILTGEQALFYVRFRHDAIGDFGRIKRQQEVIISLSQKLHNPNFMESEKLLTEIYSEYVETNIDLSKLLKYRKILDPSKQIKFDRYTLKTSGKIINKIYYGIADKDSLVSLQTRLNQ